MNQRPQLSSKEAFDASPFKSIKHSTYFEVYDELFKEFRGKPITFVEVGVLGGGSLFMWREYFGPLARIIGVDINPAAKKWEKHGFEIYIGNQSDPSFWEEMVVRIGHADILLDDGGHTYSQQIATTIGAIPLVRPIGLVVVEDTHTSYMGGFGYRRRSFTVWTQKQLKRLDNRFSAFKAAGNFSPDVWRVSFFESFVAFHVDVPKAGMRSSAVSNSGQDDFAEDLRAADPISRPTMNLIGTFIPSLRYLRLFRRKI